MTVNLPNFLNYTRSISIGEGFMYGIKSTDEGKSEFVPIEVVKRGIRGTISNYSNIYENGAARKDDDIQKQVKSPENANLQQIESAYLPNDCDRIAIKFSVAFQAESLKPSGCNSKEFYDIATEVASKYKSLGGYKELAIRYFWNVINGRTMWRNSLCQNKTVEIKVDNDKTYKFSAEGISLAKFDANELPSGSEEIVNEIAKALAGDRMPLILDVTISGELPGGSEVYPSQEYLPDVESRKRGKQYGKVLSSITTTWKNRNDFRHATMHSQKIGNAIRCIDEWHGRLDEFGTTPIEVYGYVLARNDAIRLPYKKGRNPEFGLDLFSYLDKLDEILDRLNSISDVTEIDGNIHYMMAVLIRGGVFSGESTKSKNAKKKNKNETPENNNEDA